MKASRKRQKASVWNLKTYTSVKILLIMKMQNAMAFVLQPHVAYFDPYF